MRRPTLIRFWLIAFIPVGVVLLGLVAIQSKDYFRGQLERTSIGSRIISIYHAIIPYPTDVNRVTYSIFDERSPTDIDNYKSRAALPEFTVIKGINVSTAVPIELINSIRFNSWERSGADLYSSKYSALDQINTTNVKDLAPAWIYHSNEGDWHGNVETNPVVAGGNLFAATTADFLVSINAKTGEENWRTLMRTPARRGLLWWAGNAKYAPRLFVPAIDGVYAVNPIDGKLIKDFGTGGRVGDATSLVAPAVDGDRLIIATVAPSVAAYNVETGALLWKTSLLKPASKNAREFRLSGASPWAGFSLDIARSRIYLSTGNPAPNLYGAYRPGPNHYSSSVVSIDTKSGEIQWSFQEVAHDLWDLDVPSAPVLVNLRRQGMSVDALAVVTKIGNTLLLDRDNGKPIFDFRLRRAPVSTVPGEQTWPYQPAVETPEPFFDPAFSPADITDIGVGERAHVMAALRNAQFGFFVPPVINGKVVTFGLHGGAEWPGAAVDQETGILYVPSNRYPWILRLMYSERAPNPIRSSDKIGDALYQDKCATCHGVRREGYYDRETIIAGDTRPVGDTAYPSLIGITASRNIEGDGWFRQAHKFVVLPKDVAANEIETANRYLSSADHFSDDRRSLEVSYQWGLLLDGNGHPGSKPPWGLITAINLNTGKQLWNVPFGEYPELTSRGIPITGQPNFGGLIVTKGGIVFATGTIDQKLRAYDSSSGDQLWEHDLPAAGSAPPATYEIDGIQYLVVVATGGIYAGFKDHSDTIMAFKLAKAKTLTE
jgi:quinoprotein glucose dehydrogenase